MVRCTSASLSEYRPVGNWVLFIALVTLEVWRARCKHGRGHGFGLNGLWFSLLSKYGPSGLNDLDGVPAKALTTVERNPTLADEHLSIDAILLEDFHMDIQLSMLVDSVDRKQRRPAAKAAQLILGRLSRHQLSIRPEITCASQRVAL